MAKLLEQGHFRRTPLGDDISRRLLDAYLEGLDYNRLYFTQEDVDLFRGKFGTELDDYILLGNPKPAYEIHGLYAKRVEDRVAWIKERLNRIGPAAPGEQVEINRQKAPWPADRAARLAIDLRVDDVCRHHSRQRDRPGSSALRHSSF